MSFGSSLGLVLVCEHLYHLGPTVDYRDRCFTDYIIGHLPFVAELMSCYSTEDGVSFVSGHRLRQSFQFQSVYRWGAVKTCDVHPYGPFLIVNIVHVSLLIEHFQYLSMKDFVVIGEAHGIHISNRGR